MLCVRRNEIPADDAVRAGQWVADSLVDEEERIPWPKTLSTQLCSIIICSVNSGLPRATTVAGSKQTNAKMMRRVAVVDLDEFGRVIERK